MTAQFPNNVPIAALEPMTGKESSETFSGITLPISKNVTKEKKRHRRVAADIDREFRCYIAGCSKGYGSEGALKMHIKLKHPAVKVPTREEIRNKVPWEKAKPVAPSSQSAQTLNSPPSSDSLPSTPATPEHPWSCFNCEYPVQSLAIGNWERSCSRDSVVEFSFEKELIALKFLLDTSLMKIEIPFSFIEGLAIEKICASSTLLGVYCHKLPGFYKCCFQKNGSSLWMPCTDFTNGQVQAQKLFFISFNQANARKQSLDSALQVFPGTRELLGNLPPQQHSAFLSHALDASAPARQRPTHQLLEQNLTPCATFHKSKLISIPLKQELYTPCCNFPITLRKALSFLKCQCGTTYFYSLCSEQLVSSVDHQHCDGCHTCVDPTYHSLTHCTGCEDAECGTCMNLTLSNFPAELELFFNWK